jgi:hypothetical protein
VSYFFKKIAPTCSSTRFGTPCHQLTYISSFTLLLSPFAGLFFIEALRHACVICVISLCSKGLQRKTEKMRGGSPLLFQSAIQNQRIRVIRTIRAIRDPNFFFFKLRLCCAESAPEVDHNPSVDFLNRWCLLMPHYNILVEDKLQIMITTATVYG